MSMHRMACSAVFLVVGCQQFEPEPDWVHVGQHVTVYGYGTDEDSVCPGTYTALDTVASGIARWHGFDTQALHLEYHWVARDRFFDEPWCDVGSSGCSTDSRVKSPSITHFHEVSHAVDQFYLPDRSSPLAEGFATLHRSPTSVGFDLAQHSSNTAPPHLGDIIETLLNQPAYAAHFGRVGHFVSFLVQRYGLASVNALSAKIGPKSDFDDWQREFDLTLGEPFADVMDYYYNYPMCTIDQYRAKTWECGGSIDFELAPNMDTLSLDIDLSCANERAMGLEGQELKTYLRFEVHEIPDPDPEDPWANLSQYRFDLRSGNGEVVYNDLMIERCQVGCGNTLDPTVWAQPDGGDVPGGNMFTTTHSLPAGDYAIVIRGQGEYTLSIESVDS